MSEIILLTSMVALSFGLFSFYKNKKNLKLKEIRIKESSNYKKNKGS